MAGWSCDTHYDCSIVWLWQRLNCIWFICICWTITWHEQQNMTIAKIVW